MIQISSIYFLIAFLFIIVFLNYNISIFFKSKIRKIIFPVTFGCCIISILFMYLFNHKINIFNFGMYIALVCFLFYVFFNENNFKILLLCVKSYYVFLLSFTTSFSLYEVLFRENIYILLDYNYKFIILFILSLFLYTILDLLIFRGIDLKKLVYVLSSIDIMIPISMFALLIIKNASFFYILNYSTHSLLVSIVFLASSLLEIYFGIFILLSISKAYNLSIYKYKNQILNMQYELQVNNLQQLEEYQSDIRRISHDIHNHKAVLYNLIMEKDYDSALSYLDSYGTGFSKKEYELLTNNKILNALLLSKKDICISNNISLNLDISVPKDIHVSDFDLCIIVGNLVDNAIEACKKVDLQDKPYINIKIKIVNNNFVFDMKNNFCGDINLKNGKIATSKKDKLNHGLGISNVKSTVDKYNGTCELNFIDNEFSSFIMIPFS